MRNTTSTGSLDRAKRSFIKTCLRHREQAYINLLFMETQARYDSDPELRKRIEDHKNFIALIDMDLAKAGLVLH